MMRLFGVSVLGIVLLLATASAGTASSFKAGGTMFNVRTKTLADMHFEGVVRQSYDLSCGAAAIATLLKNFYGQDVTEKQVIEAMIEIGDPEKIAKKGFSMLELKRFAEAKGFVSQGYRIPDTESLRKLKVPVVTMVNTRGYSHFVVLKSIRGNRVLIADPAFGNSVKSLSEFESEWNNVILAVLSNKLNGEPQFVQDRSIKAPASEIISLIDNVHRALPGGSGEF